MLGREYEIARSFLLFPRRPAMPVTRHVFGAIMAVSGESKGYCRAFGVTFRVLRGSLTPAKGGVLITAKVVRYA